MAALFLLGLGAKLGLILAYGSPIPYWDQWPAEGLNLFIPWFAGDHSIQLFFRPHNEHRIVFTRMLEWLLLVVNGQWDSELEMVVNAVIHSAGIAVFGGMVAPLLEKKFWPVLWLLLALDLALPFAWENTLWGFQSQYYFMLLFSLAAIWGLGLAKPGSDRWWLGALAALAALLSLASGFLAAAAVMALAFLQMNRERANWRRFAPTLGFCALIIILGFLLKKKVSDYSESQAHSAPEFFVALAKNLAWPWPLVPVYAFLNVAPLAWLVWQCLRSREKMEGFEWLTVGIGFWAVLQAMLMAYARGAGGATPAWRYMDVLYFIPFANGFSLLALLRRQRNPGLLRSLWRGAALIWVLICAGGMFHLCDRAWRAYLPQLAAEQRQQLRLLREFMATDEPRVFEDQPPEQRPVLNTEADVWLLRNPLIRAILPACVREPLPLVRATNSDSAFATGDCPLAEPEPAWEKYWCSGSTDNGTMTGSFESAPIHPGKLPYLEIPVAGYLGARGTSLTLVELGTGQVQTVRPKQFPAGHWQNLRVKSPAGPFKIVATSERAAGWFAFQAPRELGRLSYFAQQLLGAWKYIFVVGLAWFLFNLADGTLRKISR